MGQQRGTGGHDEERMHQVTRADGPGSPGGLAMHGRATEVAGTALGDPPAGEDDRPLAQEVRPEPERSRNPSNEDLGRIPSASRSPPSNPP